LKWHTPLEGIKSDMFECRLTVISLFMGRVTNALPRWKDDYTTIGPGKTVNEDVDFTEAYDIAEAGIYSVKYRTGLVQVGFGAPKAMVKQFASPERAAAVAVKAGTGIFKLLENREPKQVDGIEIEHARAMLARVAAPKAATFSSCSQAQQGPITSALAQAVNMASSAKAALDGAPSWARYTARRYSEWFGAYDAGRYATVSAHYAKILDALSNQAMKFNCDCSENYYAYVYPTKPYEVFLCKLFWTAPLTGRDSKAGTIVQSSHLSSTRRRRIMSTVKRDAGRWRRAIRATRPSDDTHEYFAENTPPLTVMRSRGRSSRSPTSGVTCRLVSAGIRRGAEQRRSFAGKCYFFKGDKYIRYDWATDKADPGYRKDLPAWRNMPAGFWRFDAAVNGQGLSRASLFL
jgi:peptidyl-Lys metalloendopeptidase